MASVVVTGSSRGIGRGVARRFAQDGYDVAVNYVRSAEAAAAVVDAIENAVEDVTTSRHCSTVIAPSRHRDERSRGLSTIP